MSDISRDISHCELHPITFGTNINIGGVLVVKEMKPDDWEGLLRPKILAVIAQIDADMKAAKDKP